MGRLDEITIGELQSQLAQTEGNVPTQRVLAAIGRKQGDNLEVLAKRHGVVEKTIRNWLDRFAEQPLEEAPYDDPRPGAPGELTDKQQAELFDDLATDPIELGYDQQAWTSSLAVHHINTKFDVEYTKRHARNLLDEAGLSWRTARPRHNEADAETEADFKETVQKNETK